ncbi:PTS mannitol-specific transporter subunit IIBC [Halobacillus litoralis]|uniref:PTS mannitol-specific transporter subunit IIBC n=1 Tax=Halobacillus litoralis TaxID=45668 RepID=UPI001CD4574D|nr:PTS mannitol-specific transporter subunit IIBC [Halobacillus litoralis]MCA1022379.1 PTS mannitol transporter subunit IICBA [Halobacillus litoralis]
MSEKQQAGFRARVQKFGSFLSSMIMPNIGAFIAWGLITALFIPDGWFPNEDLAEMVGPMITYLLPLLIGFTGGRLVHGLRGGVVGATATMGVIVGADIPMFLGAMVIGPFSGLVIKYVDKLFEGKVKSGFEMLINNFTAGIAAGILAIVGYYVVGPVMAGLTNILGSAVEFLIGAGLLPLVNIFIEPAKILFLNNAINHGILSPIAVDQTQDLGKSILFLLESNPGPGLGVLLAFTIFGKGVSRQTAPGAAIIHFFGGIHEIYFPYILSKPALLLAVIAGGVSGTATFAALGVGLTATPSPGSIIAIGTLTARGDLLGVIAGVLIAALASFLVASLILKLSKKEEEEDLNQATAQMEQMKGKKSSVSGQLTKDEEANEASTEQAPSGNTEEVPSVREGDIDRIIFACDAGMGSSAMGASLLKNKFKKAGISIDVTNMAINDLPSDVDIVITHKDLTERAMQRVPEAHHISVDNFLNSPRYDELVNELQNDEKPEESQEKAQPAPSGNTGEVPAVDEKEIDRIIFACDAGMGSSAMGASLLKNKFKKAGINIDVTNMAINDLPSDVDIVITHKDLTERAMQRVPGAHHISVDNFLNSPRYDELVNELKEDE